MQSSLRLHEILLISVLHSRSEHSNNASILPTMHDRCLVMGFQNEHVHLADVAQSTETVHGTVWVWFVLVMLRVLGTQMSSVVLLQHTTSNAQECTIFIKTGG